MGILRDLFRFLTIGGVMGVSLLAFFVALPGSLFVRDRERREAYTAALGGRVLRWCLRTLGPTFVKLGQIMSTRPDVFPSAFVDELKKLQDAMPAEPFEYVLSTLESEFGESLENRFIVFQETPVAAASVAQVHRAVLLDETEVAVKVLRPEIRAKVERDASVLLGLARLLSLIPPVRLNDPVAHLREFFDAIRLQTDLEVEADNYEIFRSNFRDVPEILFPEVYREHSTVRVLTMSFMRGTKVDALPVARRRQAGKLIRHAYFKMCFEDAFVHADLHPGNMMITDAGELVLFDVGLVKRVDDDFFWQFIDFTACLTLRHPDVFLGHFRRFHTYLEGTVDWQQLRGDLGRVMELFADQSIEELEMAEFNREIFALFRKHRIRPVPEITMLLVASMSSEGLGKFLDPDANQFEEIADKLFSTPWKPQPAPAEAAS